MATGILRLSELLMFVTVLLIIAVVNVSISATNRNTRSKDMEKYRPRRVSVQALNTTSIRLQWEQPQSADTLRCPVTRYTIRLKTDGARRSRTWKVDGSRQSTILTNLEPSTSYYVRVLAVACDGKGKPSPWVGVRTARSLEDSAELVADQDQATIDEQESSMPGKPSYVRTRTFSDSVIVSWLPPDDGSVVRGYMIGYGEGVPDVNWQYVDASRSNVTIKNLKPATQYIVSLRAFNNHGKGPVIYDLIYTREVAASRPPGPATTAPVDLRTKVLSPSTVWLGWTDPTLGRAQQLTDSRYYNVHYRPLQIPGDYMTAGPGAAPGEMAAAAAAAAARTLSLIVKELHVVFYDLQPGTRYEFKVRTVRDSVASAFSEPVVNKTYETAPSSSPRGLTLMPTNTSGSVHVSWRPPRLPNGDITGYLVLYTQEPDQPVERWQAKIVNGPTLEIIVTNLSLDSTYHFRIQARNTVGYSPISSNSVFYTKNFQAAGAGNYFKITLGTEQTPTTSPTTIHTVDDQEDMVEYEATTTTSAGSNATDSLEMENSGLESEEEMEEPHASPLIQLDSTKIKRNPPDNDLNFPPATSPIAEQQQKVLLLQPEKLMVPFQTLVHHWVSAFITWPQNAPCEKNASRRPVVFGYRLQYGKADVPTTVLNLTVNVVMIENLQPYSEYWYQLKYLYEDGTESQWTEQLVLNTK